jgi:hypothetical protein
MRSKLHLLFREVALGALNGLGFGLLAELSMRGIYTYEKALAGPSGFHQDMEILMSPYPWAWWYFPLLSVVFTSIATLFVCWFWRSRIKSVTWRWQLVGFLAVVEFYLMMLAWDLWNAHSSGFKSIDWQFAYSIKPFPWIILIPALFAYDFLFGWAAKRFGLDNGRDDFRAK